MFSKNPELVIKFNEREGRGVWTSNNIAQDTLILKCEILELNEVDTIKVNETSLKHYTFKLDETRDCLVLGHGELFNHDDIPNTRFQLEEHDGRKVMCFYSARMISMNEQLYIDYNADQSIQINEYLGARSLVS